MNLRKRLTLWWALRKAGNDFERMKIRRSIGQKFKQRRVKP
jgi:hypothetical protein